MINNRSIQRRQDQRSPSIFSESTYQSKLDVYISSVPESLRPGIELILRGLVKENIADSQKFERAKLIVKLSQQPDVKQFIEEMLSDDKTYEANLAFIAKRMNELQDQIKAAAEYDPSFIELLVKTIGAASLGNLIPGLGMLALGVPVAAAAGVPGVQWFAGQPVGGDDMCMGNTQTCEQGFLAPANQPENWFSQYSRNVEVAVAGDTIDTTFAKCLSVENVGNAVAEFFNANSTKLPGVECIANSNVVRGTMSAIRATNLPLPENDCSVFSKAIDSLYNGCSVLPDDPTKTIIIATVAGTVGLAALLTVIICCCKKSNCCKKGYTEI